MTDLEKFLNECNPDNGGDYSHDDVVKLIAMVRLLYLNAKCPALGCKRCEEMDEQLNKMAKGE